MMSNHSRLKDLDKLIDDLTKTKEEIEKDTRTCNDCAFKYNEYRQYTLNQGHCLNFLVYNKNTVCDNYKERYGLRW